ncbi:hypothetical protein, partial [Streptomyces mirabilis]|uniref:hypothetical protein n=1 Tax=Streptomyces mirabilis TaxID=68239 RepID=UPI0036696F18
GAARPGGGRRAPPPPPARRGGGAGAPRARRLGDWGRVVCANGWSAWVDGRLLVAVPQPPPAEGDPLTRTADPRPLLARVEQALTRYRSAAEDLAAGRLDGASFRGITRGQRIGVVVDGESLWLYDAEHERWVYTDGTRLSTYAVADEPEATPERNGSVPGRARTGVVRAPGDHEPTRLVPGVTDEPGDR